jgi:hypothetical protein
VKPVFNPAWKLVPLTEARAGVRGGGAIFFL